MPVLDVTLVMPASPAPDAVPDPLLAARLADCAGRALGAAPGHVWVRLHRLAAADYAENGAALADADLPAFVRVLHARLPAGPALQAEVQALTAALAACLARPATAVHLEYAPPGAGRVAFGGRLVA